MTPEEAHRVLARLEERHASCAFPRPKPWWVQGATVINGKSYDVGPVHGPKLPWVAIRERAAERRALAKNLHERGYSVGAIAHAVGVSRTTISLYLRPPKVKRPVPLWRLPAMKRRKERAVRRRLGMLAWAGRKVADAA